MKTSDSQLPRLLSREEAFGSSIAWLFVEEVALGRGLADRIERSLPWRDVLEGWIAIAQFSLG